MAVPSPLRHMARPIRGGRKMKQRLRTELKQRRADFASRHQGFLTDESARHFPAMLERWIDASTCIAGYVPIQNEADPVPLLRQMQRRLRLIALPHITGRDAPMRFLRWDVDTPLVPGPMGLMQPESHAEELAPDLIITPLVGFDRRLHRIGYGAGFYDRAFALFPKARRIGLAWSVQEVDAVPNDSWDVTLDAVWTEREWIFNGDRQD